MKFDGVFSHIQYIIWIHASLCQEFFNRTVRPGIYDSGTRIAIIYLQ